MGNLGRGKLGIACAIGALSVTPVALASEPAASPLRALDRDVAGHHVGARQRAAAHAFWTPARMRAAKPMPLLRRATGASAPSAPPAVERKPVVIPAARPGSRTHLSGQPERKTLSSGGVGPPGDGVDTGENPAEYPNNVNGKIYGVMGDDPEEGLYVCSGSIVPSISGSTVLTAGHCIYDPETDKWASQLIFIPGYRDGAKPFGEWAAVDWDITDGWYETEEIGVDVGIVEVETEPDGTPIEEELGSLGIGFDFEYEQTYTEWGYPAAGPYEDEYDGGRLYKTTSGLEGKDETTDPDAIRIASDFTEGASGGPFTDGDFTAISVTSYFIPATDPGYDPDDPDHIYGPHFEGEAYGLYCHMAGIYVGRASYNTRRGTGAAPVLAPCDGTVTLRGGGLRTQTRHPTFDAPEVTLPIVAQGKLKKRLRRRGRANARALITYFAPDGYTTDERVPVRLVRRRH